MAKAKATKAKPAAKARQAEKRTAGAKSAAKRTAGAKSAAKRTAGAKSAARAKSSKAPKAKTIAGAPEIARKRPNPWAEQIAAAREATRKAKGPMKEAFDFLCAYSQAKPFATKDHPWGHTVYKGKNKKIFAFFGCSDDELTLTVKLPQSGDAVLTLFKFATPTGYGMGKHGWVTATFHTQDSVPTPVLKEWIDESYVAVGPKR
ncbi:MAG: MmcQ/YjbR family DNA-binding protein [Deltaproteobacteria bacterium]|nr:MmcQ/YjbR family DNA-binding protein [Deltaproteobacteria bacterium]